jgi:hypothetical protein
MSAGEMLFFYVATGSRYVEEARQSAASCRRHMKSSRVVLLTPDDCDVGEFDEIIPFGSGIADPHELKVAGISAFCEQERSSAVFLDSDTFIVGEVSELGTILERFDLAAAHAPIRLQSNLRPAMGTLLTGAPPSYPELNTGVIAFRCNQTVREAFSAWLTLYRIHAATNLPRRDQPSFREVTYQSSMRLATLPPEYNCVFQRPVGICGPVKILHGRGDHALLGKQINKTSTFRAVISKKFLKDCIVLT